jgi:hypothetical protein
MGCGETLCHSRRTNCRCGRAKQSDSCDAQQGITLIEGMLGLAVWEADSGGCHRQLASLDKTLPTALNLSLGSDEVGSGYYGTGF